MLEMGTFSTIYDLRFKVFDEAEIGGNGIFVFRKEVDLPNMERFVADSQRVFLAPKHHNTVKVKSLRTDSNVNLLLSQGVANITKRISSIKCISMDQACIMYQGIITGDNGTYLSEEPQGKRWEKILRGRDIDRYHKQFGGVFVNYIPDKLWSNTNPEMFKVKEKLVSRQTSDHLVATYDNEGFFTLDSTHVIHLRKPFFLLKYLLGIYNSRLLNYLYIDKVREGGRVFAQVKTVNIKPLPIRLLDLSIHKEKMQHDQMVENVDKMLSLVSKLSATKTTHETATLQNAITATDRQIDALVYELYGLTKEEIELVEKG